MQRGKQKLLAWKGWVNLLLSWAAPLTLCCFTGMYSHCGVLMAAAAVYAEGWHAAALDSMAVSKCCNVFGTARWYQGSVLGPMAYFAVRLQHSSCSVVKGTIPT